MGTDFSNSYIKMKLQEWTNFSTHFSQWEKDNTLDI
jgi:glutamine synthetase